MLGTVNGDAVSRCQVMGRAGSVHHGANHGSRCCMVCLMPQSHVSCSLENPHFNTFTLDRPTCVRNRLSAFQVVQGFSAPAGRCSSGLMLRCTLASSKTTVLLWKTWPIMRGCSFIMQISPTTVATIPWKLILPYKKNVALESRHQSQTINSHDRCVCHNDGVVDATTSDYQLGCSD